MRPGHPTERDEQAHRQTRDTALRLLSRREHSRTELQRKLEARDLRGAIVEDVLDTLEAEDWLSDQRFTESFARSRVNAGHGPLRIARDLKSRGVAPAHIDTALNIDESVWVNLAEAVRGKKFGTETPRSYQEWAKQARFLQARGFSGEQIRQVLADDPNDD